MGQYAWHTVAFRCHVLLLRHRIAHVIRSPMGWTRARAVIVSASDTWYTALLICVLLPLEQLYVVRRLCRVQHFCGSLKID